MEYTVVMKFRGTYEAIRIEEETATKAAFRAAKSSSILKNPMFVGCYTDDEITNFIQEHAGNKSAKECLVMFFEEKITIHSNTMQFVNRFGDHKCEEDMLKIIFLEFNRSRRVSRVILGQILPAIKLEAYDYEDCGAMIYMDTNT